MTDFHPRIRTALVSVDPNIKRPAWHGVPTSRGVLRGVRAETAVWRPYPDCNNIRELTLHIAFWENSVANRLSGETRPAGFKQRKTSWAVQEDAVEEAQWKSEVRLMKDIHARLVAALEDFDPDLLDHPFGKRTKRNAVEFIHGVAEHSLYHTAQIELIKKLAQEKGIG